jgi:hypothetical protein
MTQRTLQSVIRSTPTSDGDGVKIRRLGLFNQRLADPFLMLDELVSDDEKDYMGGFPPHPHRGMETLTYLRKGALHHKDHLGNRGEIRRDVLIATDVAGRGLDVEGMDLVINYDLARKGDEYIHRIGRTGRAGREGLAISLIGPREWNLKAAIERYIQQEMEPRTIQSLKAKYTGPKKLKASGKAAGPKKKKGKDIKKALGKKGASLKKKSGPRPSKPASSLMDKEGFAPIKRKKQAD